MTSASEPLKGLDAARRQMGKGKLPVHLWDPPFCGNIDMRIAADGTWYYMKSPIGRLRLVKLFSSLLRLEDDGRYYLVTPVEKCGIEVEDAAFAAVRMRVEGEGVTRVIYLETQVEEEVPVGAQHPLRFADQAKTGGLKPYVLIRRNLEALVARSLFYDLVSLGTIEGDYFGVWSSGRFFPMKKASDVQI